jgi:hypothetical protein
MEGSRLATEIADDRTREFCCELPMTQTGEYRLRRSSGGMREGGMLPIGYLRDPNCVEEINNLDPSLETNMHTILVASAFMLMVLSPCFVAMRSSSLPEEKIQ